MLMAAVKVFLNTKCFFRSQSFHFDSLRQIVGQEVAQFSPANYQLKIRPDVISWVDY